MANAASVQFALILGAAVILTAVLVLFMRKKATAEPSGDANATVPIARPVVEKPQSVRPKPAAVPRTEPDTAGQPARPVVVETAVTLATARGGSPTPVAQAPLPPTVIEVHAVSRSRESRNERILAGISENIRKSLSARPVAEHSVPAPETKTRSNEYVRVKREIITPHGNIRFSILKDWMTINMLAVLRRASLEWKTPDDLIGFLPAYLEPEADVLNNEVLVIGTPGHNERLAVPLRRLDAPSELRDCFDFVDDVRTATNTPAVLMFFDDDFEIVSKGVITQSAFTAAREQIQHTDIKLLVDGMPHALRA
jgi:hypothetical protein